MFVFITLFAVTSYPYTSTIRYTLSNNDKLLAKQISQDDKTYLVIASRDSRVLLVQKNEVKKLQVCREKAKSPTDFLNRSLYDNLASNQRMLEEC